MEKGEKGLTLSIMVVWEKLFCIFPIISNDTHVSNKYICKNPKKFKNFIKNKKMYKIEKKEKKLYF